MRYAVALLAAGAVYLAITLPRAQQITVRVGSYLSPVRRQATPGRFSVSAGLIAGEHLPRQLLAALGGALAGVLLAQGDLFVEGTGRSVVPLALIGAATGWLVYGMYRSTTRQRRARRLRFELPVVADTLALHIIAGESVGTAIARFVEAAEGVSSEELAAVLDAHQEGASLSESLQQADRKTAAKDATRLYTLLAHAHDTGGRLADNLTDLSTDYRAALARDLTAEGGKRALATYGPVLALMVPVTLLFLMYPTLAGLRSLAGSP